MKYVQEFRDAHTAKGLVREIERLSQQLGNTAEHPLKIMEVCGGILILFLIWH